jgi:sulfate transport system substrate-binding protein
MHQPPFRTPLSRRAVLRLGGAAAALAAASPLASRGAPAAAQDGGTLTLVAYSTPREAYEEIIPLFQATPAGQGVQFEQSYGSSGEQSRAVEGGLPADVVALSLEPDVTRLVEAGLVDEGWNEGEHAGMVTDSVVVLAVRPGNPKNVQGWADLVADGVQVLIPNPLTSGGARWNVMAAWGAQIAQGKGEEEATEYLRQLFANVPVQDKSARESLQTFVGGVGDVLLAYENEIIFAQQQGEEVEFVVPAETILIENPVAVVNESENAETARAFIDFLLTPRRSASSARRATARSSRRCWPSSTTRPRPPSSRSPDHGGWSEVTPKFFDPGHRDRGHGAGEPGGLMSVSSTGAGGGGRPPPRPPPAGRRGAAGAGRRRPLPEPDRADPPAPPSSPARRRGGWPDSGPRRRGPRRWPRSS